MNTKQKAYVVYQYLEAEQINQFTFAELKKAVLKIWGTKDQKQIQNYAEAMLDEEWIKKINISPYSGAIFELKKGCQPPVFGAKKLEQLLKKPD